MCLHVSVLCACVSFTDQLEHSHHVCLLCCSEQSGNWSDMDVGQQVDFRLGQTIR